MHSATLAVAAYALLSSSFAALFYLLKENIKKCVVSPLHIFTISDALSSIFAGIMFLVNQLNMNSKSYQENENISNKTKFNRDILHFIKYNEEGIDRNEFENCEFRYVMMQYGMFFIPFTNAFISLLGYSLHYITNIIRVDGSCMELIRPIKQIIQKETMIKNRESLKASPSPETSSKRKRDSNFDSIVSPDEIKTTALNILKETTSNKLSKYDKITLISVVIEWVVPILITAILHFGEYQRLSEERNLKNDECVFATNFPFEDCYFLPNESDSSLSKLLSNSTPNLTVHNYIETQDSFQWENQNSSEIDNVVSNVYKLMQTTLDENRANNFSHYNTTDLWNITRFMDKTSMSSESKNKDEWKLFEDVEKAANQTNLELEANSNTDIVYSIMEDKVDDSHFETNTGKILDDKIQTDYNSYIGSFDNKKTISQNEIYEDLKKRIQNGNPKVKTKEKLRLNRKFQSNQNEFSIPQNESQCSRNQCFISTRFLKIHLFILLFIVYFIPILASTILNVCATYKFKQVREKVETNCVTLKILTNFGKEKVEMKNKNENYEDTIDVKKVGWFQEKKEFQKIKELDEDQATSMEIEIINEEEMFTDILEDLGKAEKFSKIFKINLLLAVLLWTPLFMEVLFKVFLCMKVPNWLMDSSFLGAVSFGIVRNFLNINIIKILRISEKTKKDNSVHPSS